MQLSTMQCNATDFEETVAEDATEAIRQKCHKAELLLHRQRAAEPSKISILADEKHFANFSLVFSISDECGSFHRMRRERRKLRAEMW